MHAHPPIRRAALGTCLLTIAGLGAGTVSGTASGPPPAAAFTTNVRADAAESGSGQNEPQVAVDQSGRAYVSWQSSTGAGGSAVASTTTGSAFTYLGDPDPSHGNPIDGDVDLATTSWPSLSTTPSVSGGGDNGVVFGHLNLGMCGAIEIRDATSKDQGATWNTTDSACAPTQIDRPWVAAYTPPTYRGTAAAVAHTEVFNEYHDFASSEIFVTRSFDGGATWDPVQYPAIAPASIEHATTFCNSIPSGVAVDQRGAHKGRVYVMWETADQPNNALQGCDLTQAEAFDHVFLSWSDDIGDPTVSTPTWTSSVVFNDPCAPSPPAPPTNPTSCQDVSELFNSLAVDDAGNVFAAYIFRDIAAANPEYDVYTSESTDGGNNFGTAHKVNTDTGSHYEPWIVAGASGAIDVVFYRTAEVESTGLLQKPAGATASAVWDVYLAQSLDGGQSFTENKVSDANDATGGIYFGDICTTGIFCGATPPGSGWGSHRTLFDVFGVAIGPDGGARVAWTDARASHSGACVTGGTVTCQSTHVMFACQRSGTGLHGETVTGCGSATSPVVVPDARWVPALGLAGVAALMLGWVRGRRRWARGQPTARG